jgi:hypothetical protein
VLTAKTCNKKILCAAQDFIIDTYLHPADYCSFNMPALYICLTPSVLRREADVGTHSPWIFSDLLGEWKDTVF